MTLKKLPLKQIKEIAEADLIWPRNGKHYRNRMNEVLRHHNIPYRKDIEDNKDYPCDNLVHEELWWDVCELSAKLAQQLLDEREQFKAILDDLKYEMKNSIKAINKIKHKSSI